MALKTYRDLEVWQEAINMVEKVYLLSRNLPRDEKFGMVSQIRRAAASVPANIAEGYGRIHRGDYLRHLSIARGSLMEVETFLILAVRLNFIEKDQMKVAWENIQKVGILLFRLIKSLNN